MNTLDDLAALDDPGTEGTIVADSLGRVQTLNRSAELIFGYPETELINRELHLLMPDAGRIQTNNSLEHVASGHAVDGLRMIGIGREVKGRRKDGSTIELELTMFDLRGIDGLRYSISAIRDVTQRNLQVRDLQSAIEEAKQARMDAERANRAKTDFLAVMSHEVRTPITSINGFVDLLTATGTLTRQQRRYVDLVKTANEALLTVVNDILDFSKVEAGQLELESHPFSPTSLIHDVVGIVQPNASAKNLRLEYTIDRGVPEWLNGDRARLRQVLLNLLNNAIKFSEKGTIKIYLCEQASSDGRRRLQFTVKDEGVGIPPKHQHRLFKTFSQADSSVTRRHGGTGLGLAICKRLVALMDGEIEIVSQAGSGTAVSFTANLPPGSQPSPREDQVPRFENIDTIKARILTVDDIDTNREIAHAFLTDKGYRVDTAGNASDAIRMIRSEQYDLVLMDIQMPEMDGVTATKLIRALPDRVKDIPIIAMTANVLPRQVRSFLDAGMDDFVGKPIERGKLYKKVMHWSQTRSDRETSPARKSSHFSEMKYDQFIRIIGAPKAEPAAAQFLELLTATFKSTPQVSRREAHDLINVAGLFGFDGLVDACRAINQLSPEQADLESALLDEVKRAQSMAQQTLIGHVLPNLRGALLRPAR